MSSDSDHFLTLLSAGNIKFSASLLEITNNGYNHFDLVDTIMQVHINSIFIPVA